MSSQNITNAKRERLLNQCENLLLQGVESISDISEQLGVSHNTAKTYIELVRDRWVLSANVDELQHKRLELIKKTEKIISEAWVLRSTAKNNLEASSALRVALSAIERLERLQGIGSLPLPIEKPRALQMYDLAQKANALPKPQRDAFVQKLKNEIERRRKANANISTRSEEKPSFV